MNYFTNLCFSCLKNTWLKVVFSYIGSGVYHLRIHHHLRVLVSRGLYKAFTLLYYQMVYLISYCGPGYWSLNKVVNKARHQGHKCCLQFYKSLFRAWLIEIRSSVHLRAYLMLSSLTTIFVHIWCCQAWQPSSCIMDVVKLDNHLVTSTIFRKKSVIRNIFQFNNHLANYCQYLV